MKTRTIDEARGKLGSLLPPQCHDAVCITRHGTPVGVIVPSDWFLLDDDEILRRIAVVRNTLRQESDLSHTPV
jgi:prevent-host-death family protein